MKKGTLLFFLVFFKFMLLSQPGLQLQYKLCIECPNGDEQNINYTYDAAPSDYETDHIESDYDMRITAGTKYHQGIDYLPRNTCRGDAVLSVEGGTVAFVKGTGSLKLIAVQNGNRAFVYMHIFRDTVLASGIRSGNFMLIPVGNQYAIINMNVTPAIAYARDTGLKIIYKHHANSTTTDTIYTTNQVVAGAMIAPIGNSGGVPLHLHVALIENPIPFNNSTNQSDPSFIGGRNLDRSIDPWTDLTHATNGFSQRLRTRKPGNFSLQTCEHPGPIGATDPWGQINLSYVNDTRNTIEIEVGMENADTASTNGGSNNDASRYNNTVMDEEEVVLGIKRIGANSDFKVAKGSDFDSKFVLNPVGTKSIYPARMYDPGGGAYGGIYGDPNTNGISPMTYRDNAGFHPHDYYFISDFYLRLHKGDQQLPIKTHQLALYPSDAYYADGSYQI